MKLVSRRTLRDRLFTNVDAASLAVFRIGFGGIMLFGILRYFHMDWVRPWSGTGMYLHFAGLALLAFFIATGFLYRFSCIAFRPGFACVFLLDQTRSLNHFYRDILPGMLLSVLPAQRAFPAVAQLRRSPVAAVFPAWAVWFCGHSSRCCMSARGSSS